MWPTALIFAEALRQTGVTAPPLEMSVFTEQADLEAVIAMIQELDYVDQDNLFLMGTSQAGAVSAITGAAHPQEIRGMILCNSRL